jgi:hypothetical protein
MTAYIVGIICAVLFCVGNLYFIGVKNGYPWVAAIPMTLWRYIITSTLLSAVFVIGDNFILTFAIPVIILIIGHILVFAFYFVMLLLLHTGQSYIDETDKKVAVKRQFIKELNTALTIIRDSASEGVKKDIQAVIDAVKFSDPMSHESLSPVEDDIRDVAARLGQLTEPEQIRSHKTG